MVKLIIKLENLSCASCAEKLQNKINNIHGVKSAYVNIVNSKANIEYEGISENNLMAQIKEVCLALGVNVVNYTDLKSGAISYKNLDKRLKLRLLRYIIGLAIYVFALIFNFEYAISTGLFMASYIIFGADIILKAIKSILRGDFFNENFLMSIASIGAIYIGLYSEAVAVMIFFQIGEFFQDMAVNRSKKSIKDLLDIKAEYANIIINEVIKKVEPTEVNIGDIILIKPGEKVPLDGIIIEGKSQVDASSIIGESIPQNLKPKDEIISGTVNLTGVLKVKVTKDYLNCTVSKIMDMVENAGSKKATTERFITQFAKIYTPIVVLIALLLMFVPPLIVPYYNQSDWIYKGLVFLLVSCPCALHLSVPLTFFSGIGTASRKGILIKGSTYLQTLSDISIMVFDKTGTLTKGVFTVSSIYPKNGLTENELIQIAGSIEVFSNHPIAKSIVKECEKRHINIKSESIKNFEELHGKGLKATLNNEEEIILGNEKLMQFKNISYENYDGMGTVIHVAKNNKYMGFIVISDIIKEDSKSAIQSLKEQGIKHTFMLSGDRKESAYKVASTLGIGQTYAQLLPNQKVEILEEIYVKYKDAKIACVGDGINDAPLLTRANIGIAMGGLGSDAAIEAADIVIMTDEVSKIVDAINISKKTMAIVKQNIVLVLGVKFIVLFLTLIGLGNIWFAIIADTGVTLVAVLNSIKKKTP